MSERLYYDDSRLCTFDAVVTSCVAVDGRHEVQLDRTAFYPTSGGQPFDTGHIGEHAVIDVVDRDDTIVHVVSGSIPAGTRVQATIDWERRRDHMEQHTGQHVLSAAIEAACGVATVGFHMGADACTIDLARELAVEEIAAAEREANRVIRDDRSVIVRVVAAGDVPSLRLRRPASRAGALRIVEVADFDVSACGGTHVSRTGEIGVVMALAWERVRGGTRLTFVCGGRALTALQRLRETTMGTARLLGVGPGDIALHVGRLQQAGRDADRRLREARDELVALRVPAWRGAAETIGGHRVVLRAEAGGDAGELKQLAQALTAEAGFVVVLVGSGEPCPVVVARSVDVAFDAAAFMKAAASAIGGRGGGRADLAQGGLAATGDAVLAFARQALADDGSAGPDDGRPS